MLIAAAVCPHPPLLVPELARGAAPELETLRAECDRAVAGLLDSGVDEITVVGAGERSRTHGAGTGGGMAGYGVDFAVGPPPATLPLSLTVGRWLAERCGAAPARYVEVATGAPVGQCLALGAELAASVPRLGILAMGDGSARRTACSPGYVDEHAVPFDDSVAAALAAADTAALAELDPPAAAELMAAGRAAWQVLAGAAAQAGLRGELLAYEAPYGVGYFVALWTPR